MRYAADHKAQTRRRILDAAAAGLRTSGAEGLAVAAVMRAADLTHGGFYGHFASREALIAETIARMFASGKGHFGDDGGDPRTCLSRFIQAYVSLAHVTAMAGGCPLPALGGELPRLGQDARARYREGQDRLVGRLADWLDAIGHDDPRSLARSVLAEMVGAVMLARTVDEDEARTILGASRSALRDRLGL